MKKTAVNSMCILLAGILLGAVLLVGVYLLPVNENSANAVASMEILDAEGWYPAVPIFKGTDFAVFAQNNAGILDNYTDSIMVSTAVYDGASPLYQAMNMAGSVMPEGYSYYWHGYVSVLRPLLLFFDYGEIRLINQMVQVLLVFMLCAILYQKKGMKWALLMLTTYFLLMPMALGNSLQYSWVFYIGVIASILIAARPDFRTKSPSLLYLFLVVGMVTSYFDLLTYPLFTWAIPLLVWFIVREKDDGLDGLKTVVTAGIFWILGYAGMWTGKWVLSQVVLQKDVILAAWNEILFRSDIQGNEETARGTSIITNLVRYANKQNLVIFASWIAYFAYKLIKNKGKIYVKNFSPILLIGVSPFVWYFVLHNHTSLHVWFTYRVHTITFTALLVLLLQAVDSESGAEFSCLFEKKGKH